MKTIFDSFCTVFAAAAAARYIVSKTKGLCARESTLAFATWEWGVGAIVVRATVPSYPMIIFDVSTAGIRKWSLTSRLARNKAHKIRNAIVSRMFRNYFRLAKYTRK